MVSLLDHGSKEHAADCLETLTPASDTFRFRLAVASDAACCSTSTQPAAPPRHLPRSTWDERSVPSLVQLLDPSPANTAKKYAVACLLALSSAKRCKRMMISHGAIGYLKKLTDMEVAGAGDLLDRLEDRGRLRSIFSKN